MNVKLDNIIFSKSRNGGISNYWYELSQYLLANQDVNLSFFEEKDSEQNFHRGKLNIPQQDIISGIGLPPLLSRLLPIQYKSSEKFIYHSSYYRKLAGCKNQIEVTTVYDFIHSYYFPYLNKQIHNNLKFNAIKRAKGIICISKNTYNDLQRFCPAKPHQKIEVIHVGVSNDYYPINQKTPTQIQFLKHHTLEENYLLFVGGRTSYKNFDFAASVINDNRDLKLAIVGGGPLTPEEVKLFSKESFQRVVLIPSAENHELNLLFNNAFALLYPSSYEGFGIPVVEAMRAGCPVIGFNNATIREVAENTALLLDNVSTQEFNIQKAKLENRDFRTDVIERGFLESTNYSWDKCNRETFEFYESLY